MSLLIGRLVMAGDVTIQVDQDTLLWSVAVYSEDKVSPKVAPIQDQLMPLFTVASLCCVEVDAEE